MTRFGVIAVLLACVSVTPAMACDYSNCTGGDEMRERFTIQVQFEGKPLAGVEVIIYGESRRTPKESKFVTDSNGIAAVGPLPNGNYGINSIPFGVVIAFKCFQVTTKSRKQGKSEMHFSLGGHAQTVARMAGHLSDWAYSVPLDRVLQRNGKMMPADG